MFLKYKCLIILFFFLVGILRTEAQEFAPPTVQSMVGDSVAPAPKDTTARLDTIPKRSAGLDAPVDYQANDSIIITADNWAYLYGEGDVKYQQIELQSEIIEMNMDSSLVYAKFGLDSVGTEFGYPLFKDGEQQYESKTMRYNFNTKKGYITDVITQQGEGYVTAGQTKKMDNDVLNMVGGKYTTCDDHDHPHFYIQMTKAKVQPKKRIITGPVYMVFEDVPLYPIGLPFCFFPFSNSYSSGIIFPTFGDESSRGFYLRDGGYYFALSDYMDLALTGEIYTKGSWGLSARSSYRKRYKFSGNFNASYLVTRLGDKGLPDYSLSKDFKINWTHSQDAKANPYRTFSASVNFSTSSYDRNNMNGFFPGSNNGSYAENTQNTKGSSINITQRFPNNPFSLSATMNINQRSRDSSISVTLPDITITMSRIFPFKRKHAIGKERWYEKISMSYNGYLRNSIDTREDKLFKSSLVKDWRNAMQHQIPVSATFSLFKYLNISPSFNYTERWYSNKVEKAYDMQKKQIVDRDTIYGFYRVFDYSTSVSASTTLYGFYKPLPFLGDRIKMIRHRFEPSVTLSYTPDFGAPKFGFWKDIQYEDAYGQMQTYSYSPFTSQMFGTSPTGTQGSVSFQLDNNLEMKIKSDRDSTGERKISLIDKLSLGMNYNMAADSFKWSDLNVGLRLKFSKSYTLNLTGVFDTYTYGYDETTKTVRRLNIPRWRAGKGIGRLRSTGTSFSYTFNNDTFSKLFGGKEKSSSNSDNSGTDSDYENDPQLEEVLPGEENKSQNQEGGGRLRGTKKNDGDFDSDGYMINKIPWSLSFSYSMQLRYDNNKFDTKKMEYKYALTHALSFNGNIQPTKNWRFDFNATYDFDTHKISYMTCNITRNLHCWQMSASFVPVGPYKSYTFNIAVSSSLLKDLKWRQSSNYRDGQQWY
ncbi:putative LPS assembly protein LptD [Parabacteroides sp. AM08-6]|uniref:putative LPS assembly protein LptD n=1 Tax=Parabacteroides sp. AM08-6 TaxID=2292053 RepID=UPI000F00EBBC|nr:putative LPS assembly protein LptD [Parabacteroides sp. AM08-6]RHJ86539.1 LPS-assembly protein LptD [Parabacteroides sp. AM08-6]